jgi:hypothetical protein
MDLKKIVRNPNTYIWLGSAVVVIGLILVLTQKKRSVVAIPGETPSPAGTGSASPKVVTSKTTTTAKTAGAAPVVITNYDSVWDYKLENGVWYTKKKTSSTWLDMKQHLTASDYTTSVAKLTAFLKK